MTYAPCCSKRVQRGAVCFAGHTHETKVDNSGPVVL